MQAPICSSLTMRDIKETVDSLRPIRVYVDDKLAWDEDNDVLIKYEGLFRLDLIVTKIEFTIVSLHHSYVKITTGK